LGLIRRSSCLGSLTVQPQRMTLNKFAQLRTGGFSEPVRNPLIDLAPLCIRQMTGLLGDDSGVKLTDLPGLQRRQGLREYRTQRDRGMGQGRPDKGGFSAGQTDFGLNTFTPHRRRNTSIGFSSFS